MQKVITLLFLLSACCLADKINLAVNDLSSENVDSTVISILSDRVRAEFTSSSFFDVVERKEMNAILAEQGFQQTGVCEESSCLVEVGQLLGVSQIVAGSVGKLNDNFFTVMLRIIDVETGEIIESATYDHAGSLEKLLIEGLKNAVGKLLHKSGNSNRFVGMTGDVYIETSISGATIEINGNIRSEKTPVLLEEFPAGEYDLVVRKDDFIGRTHFILANGDLLKLNLEMSKLYPTLVIKTAPAKSTIFINENKMGESPIKIDTLAAGDHSLILRNDGYKSITKNISLVAGERLEIVEEMEPAGGLKITSKPFGAELTINGEVVGKTPWNDPELAVGEHSIALTFPDYEAVHDTVLLSHRMSLEQNYTLSLTESAAKDLKKRKQWMRRIVFGSLAAGSFALGVRSNHKLKDARQTYDNYNGINSNIHIKNWNAVDDATKGRRVGYSIAAVLGTAFVISVPF